MHISYYEKNINHHQELQYKLLWTVLFIVLPAPVLSIFTFSYISWQTVCYQKMLY